MNIEFLGTICKSVQSSTVPNLQQYSVKMLYTEILFAVHAFLAPLGCSEGLGFP